MDDDAIRALRRSIIAKQAAEADSGVLTMTSDDLHRAAHLMARQGGHFASAIAAAYFAADSQNRARLLAAFGDLFARFHRYQSEA
jgi:hypothetical protein